MSTLDSNKESVWSNLGNETLELKHEKCRNIAEEIYKRINITFEIKKLENSTLSHESELSDQIDSNELSNGTDLFACDKSDSIPSSNDEKPIVQRKVLVKCINNNNEEKKTPALSKRPRKRFRKRVKKHQLKRNISSWSSDEALPTEAEASNSKPKTLLPDKKQTKQKETKEQKQKEPKNQEKQNNSADLKPTTSNTDKETNEKSSNIVLRISKGKRV